jgi:hypothetical protein
MPWGEARAQLRPREWGHLTSGRTARGIESGGFEFAGCQFGGWVAGADENGEAAASPARALAGRSVFANCAFARWRALGSGAATEARRAMAGMIGRCSAWCGDALGDAPDCQRPCTPAEFADCLGQRRWPLDGLFSKSSGLGALCRCAAAPFLRNSTAADRGAHARSDIGSSGRPERIDLSRKPGVFPRMSAPEGAQSKGGILSSARSVRSVASRTTVGSHSHRLRCSDTVGCDSKWRFGRVSVIWPEHRVCVGRTRNPRPGDA